VPDPATESLRDLVRRRESAVKDRTRHRNQVGKFLLRRGRAKPQGWTSWTGKHWNWLRQQDFEQLSDKVLLTEMLYELEHADERIKRLEKAIDDALERAPAEQQEVVAALTTLRGVAQLTRGNAHERVRLVLTVPVGGSADELRGPGAQRALLGRAGKSQARRHHQDG